MERDEGTEVVSAACDGRLTFPPELGIFSWLSRVRVNPTHRTIVQDTIPKENLPPTSREGWCQGPGCQPSPPLVERTTPFALQIPRSFFDLLMQCLSCEVRYFTPIICREAPLSTVCILPIFMLGVAVDACALLRLESKWPLQEVPTVHVAVSTFNVLDLLVKFSRTVSCHLFLVLRPIFVALIAIWRLRQSFVPHTTTRVRVLEIGDLHVVVGPGIFVFFLLLGARRFPLARICLFPF